MKRPTVKARKGAMSDNSTIIEVTGPSGQGLLIEVYEALEGALMVRPYRADERVYVQTGSNKPALKYRDYMWV